MKVENSHIKQLLQQEAGSASAVDKAQRAKAGQKISADLSGKDKASLSESARLLAAARSELANAPDVRAEVVENIKQKVDAGTYTVPVEELAKKMISRIDLSS